MIIDIERLLNMWRGDRRCIRDVTVGCEMKRLDLRRRDCMHRTDQYHPSSVVAAICWFSWVPCVCDMLRLPASQPFFDVTMRLGEL